MELNKYIKIVYKDNLDIKVLRGLLIEEDQFTYTLLLNNSKNVVIGKSVLIKATSDDNMVNNNG